MDPETWPDLFIALLSSLVFVGLPGLLLALAMNG
jgi:hypothetical protein